MFFSNMPQTRFSSCLYPANYFSPQLFGSQCHQLPGRCLPDQDCVWDHSSSAHCALYPCYTLDKNHQEKHWPTNEHPASPRIRPKVLLPNLFYPLPNTGGSCWWQLSCCELDRLTQDCPKSPAQKISPENWSSWISATFTIIIAFLVNFRLSHCLQPVNCHKILICTSWNW